MPIRHLINNDGQPFNREELRSIRDRLDALSDNDRIRYREDNAQTIARHPANKLLIVSGPGTGKSALFKERIKYWLQNNPSANILTLSFVRKLVADLQNDIKGDSGLTPEQKNQTEVFTLHKYARSIVERNHGSSQIRFGAHFRIISELWKETIWNDALLYTGQSNHNAYAWNRYEKQLHDSNLDASPDWLILRDAYLALCKFYNAAGFADLIIYAKDALIENASLNQHDFYIIDEYQDFNVAEEQLINRLSQRAQGLLIVGDDDQVLYEKLKSSKAILIQNLYRNTDYVNAMLPYCSRSSYHIIKTTGHFILQESENSCIEKIYLPLSNHTDLPKVQVIGCATSATAVDYIKIFIEENRRKIEDRKDGLNDGTEKDPFLLILTPAKEMNFYAGRITRAKEELIEMVAEFERETKKYSEDYYRILNYYSLANHPENNFIFRKVLKYEQIPDADVVSIIKGCLETGVNIYRSTAEIIPAILTRCRNIKIIVESSDGIEEKIRKIGREIILKDPNRLRADMEMRAINETRLRETEREEEEEAELDEIKAQQMSAVELITIYGSKGLSADHVMIIGFDDVNMSRVTRNAFYVAMTRARKSLHLITALKSGGANRPHAFLDRLPEPHIECYKYKKTDHQKARFSTRYQLIGYLEGLNRRHSGPQR